MIQRSLNSNESVRKWQVVIVCTICYLHVKLNFKRKLASQIKSRNGLKYDHAYMKYETTKIV